MIHAIIIDDEPKAIQGLTWELKRFKQDIVILDTFTNPEDAVEYLKNPKSQIDCLFLDIQMPTMDGFQLLSKIDTTNVSVIFTTAYDEYAIKAIKQQALDYLLKPIDSDDLQSTIEKLKQNNSQYIEIQKFEKLLDKYNRESKKKRITVNTDGKLIFLEETDILFVESDGNYSTLHLVNNQKLVLTKKLKEVNALLPENTFFRIHNSFIINIDQVKEFLKSEGYVIMSSNHKIPVARQRKVDFLEKL
ncbi:LytR/AlgR family response regulator transcription factor [Mangrovimonas aestuarii]|uniref:LytR/AlgR family response regulator transcription factor n=1 Tax=Mangrovimonas aestuarii TaxID=3018443 RepID=UPI0023792D6F|nr:LytTR family DNA-binding domain-containing protein [Mangrovimonas aestuarii]